MSIESKVKNLQKKITKLHKERSAAWNGPEKIYWRINRELNRTKKAYDRLLLWASRNQINTKTVLPVYNGPTSAIYLRYETMADELKNKIFMLEYAQGHSHLYATKNGIAKSLKDAWADCQNLN